MRSCMGVYMGQHGLCFFVLVKKRSQITKGTIILEYSNRICNQMRNISS